MNAVDQVGAQADIRSGRSVLQLPCVQIRRSAHKHGLTDEVIGHVLRLTEADFERMATAAETAEFDIERLAKSAVRSGGRPRLGIGPSSVLQVRLDGQTRARLAERATHDHRTPSSIAREAIEAWLNAS